MSGVANSELQLTKPARSPLDAETLLRLAPDLEQELRRYLSVYAPVAGRRSPFNLAALKELLRRLLEVEVTAEDQRRCLLFAAPLVRRVLFTCAATINKRPPEALNIRQIELWLQRLEAFDPLAVLMIDLHYCCGLSVRETAGVLGVSLATVICDLRFARAWLHAYLGRPLARRA
jgi:ECF sigma factor